MTKKAREIVGELNLRMKENRMKNRARRFNYYEQG